MASNKVEMSLDDIIKKDRKTGPKKGPKNGPKKGGITKKVGVNARKGKFAKKNIGGKLANQKKIGDAVATKRLVQKLVKKALAQSNNNGGRKNANQQQTRVVRQVIQAVQKPRGINRRSQIISKSPRTETVIVRRVVKPRPQPRQQIIREVIVQEPRQRTIRQPIRRFNNNSRPQVVYVQERSNFGGNQPRSNFGGQQQQYRVVNQPRPQFGGQQRSQFGGQQRFGGGKFQRQRRQNNDPFYEPVSYLQR